jgi:RHS repeat-associated protein
MQRTYTNTFLLLAFHYAENKAKMEGIVHCGYTHSFDDGNGYTVTATKHLTSVFSFENICSGGFTGHEHLPWFGLINMNARLYDPAVGRFLSPDPFVQAPLFSQSYNRYTYCLNNPLSYTDEDGEFWNFVIGAVVGGLINWGANGFKFNAQGLGHFGVGAAAGALGAGIGAGISSAMAGGSFGAGFVGSSAAMTASSSFLSGAAIGSGAGFASGFTTNFGNALLDGKNLGQAFESGLKGGIGGAIGGAIGGGLSGARSAFRDGRHIWTGRNFEIGDRTLTGTFVGKFEGVNVFESSRLGSIETGSAGLALPPGRGIVVGTGVFNSTYEGARALLQHEFGHFLQHQLIGSGVFYSVIGTGSLLSAAVSTYEQHNNRWFEQWANYLAHNHFGNRSQLSTSPTQNISSTRLRFLSAPRRLFQLFRL